MLDFPDTPTDGQRFDEEGTAWEWNAAMSCWVIAGPFIVSAAPNLTGGFFPYTQRDAVGGSIGLPTAPAAGWHDVRNGYRLTDSDGVGVNPTIELSTVVTPPVKTLNWTDTATGNPFIAGGVRMMDPATNALKYPSTVHMTLIHETEAMPNSAAPVSEAWGWNFGVAGTTAGSASVSSAAVLFNRNVNTPCTMGIGRRDTIRLFNLASTGYVMPGGCLLNGVDVTTLTQKQAFDICTDPGKVLVIDVWSTADTPWVAAGLYIGGGAAAKWAGVRCTMSGRTVAFTTWDTTPTAQDLIDRRAATKLAAGVSF